MKAISLSTTSLTTTAMALVLGLGWALPATAQLPDPVRVGIDVDAGSLDPRLARDTTAYRVVDLIYDGLVRLNASLEPQPGLAVSWENPEPTEWIFTLREGVTFQDGSAFTAEDVVFTYETALNPDFGAPFRALISPIETIEAVDDHTVRMTLSAPYSPLLSYLDIGIVPSDLVESGHDIAIEPVGTGPLTLEEWDRGSRLLLAPNEDYWGEVPAASMEIVVIGDNTSRAQAFEAGDLHLIQSPLSPRDILRLAEDDSYENAIESGLGVTYLNINTSVPLLSDPRMRQAIAMLVDQDTIVNQIYEGVDTVANGVLLPSSWAYSEDIQQPGFDPEGAVALLNELGWTDSDGDGILDRDGETLTIEVATHSEDPNRIQSVEYIQAVMQSVGIDAQISISDWPSYSGRVQNSGHQIGLQGWLNIVDPDRMLFGQLTTDGPLNWGGYSNPEVDALLREGRQALSQEERTEAYRAAAEILSEELPYYIISYQGYQVFWDPALGDIDVNPRGFLRGVVMD